MLTDHCLLITDVITLLLNTLRSSLSWISLGPDSGICASLQQAKAQRADLGRIYRISTDSFGR
jgi:hypothetical protein